VDLARGGSWDRQLRTLAFVTDTARDCRVVAITFRSPIQPTRVEGPHLGIIYGQNPAVMYWEPGGLQMVLPQEHTIVKEYPARCDRLGDDWQLAALAFGREFPPVRTEPEPSAAWIAPDGSFYQCRWMEHDRLGYRLSGAHYKDPGGPRTLERRGWMRLQHDGTIVWPSLSHPPSQSQLDVLFTLMQASTGAFRANVREELEMALTAERLRSGRND
jgi:hypothetical protein